MDHVKLARTSRAYQTFTVETLEGGSGRTPVLFLHGEEGLRHDRSFLESLAQDYAVTAPYHPGFAGSDRRVLPSGMCELINLYLYLLRHVARAGRGPVVVIGAGFGGWLAAELAIRSPAEVAALYLLAPVGVRTRPPMEREIADVFNVDLPQLRKIWFAGEADDFLDPSRMEDQDWLSLAQDREGLARYAWVPYMHDPALASGLGLIEAPTLCLWNRGDAAVREGYYADLAKLIPGSRTAALEGRGHFPVLTDRRRCIAALRDFLQSTPVASTGTLVDAWR
jgi:pimeloyl-ACP methyl ester carboxylesterase